MRRILITARWPVGGIRTFLKYVYAHTDVTKHAIAFALPDVEESRQLERDLAGLSATWHWLPARTSEYVWALRRLVSHESVDLIHSHGFTALLAATVSGASCPHIVTVHDVLLDRQLAGIKGRLRGLSLRVALSRANAVHAVSQACADNLVQMLRLRAHAAARVEVIRNGIEVQAFRDAVSDDLRGRLDIPQGTLLLGFFGRFMNQKGFRYIVDAVELLRQSNRRRVRVVCVGSGGFRARELRDLQDRGLEDAFAFIDFVPHVGALMKSVDAVLMPSLWEACGLVAMEAMIAGVPLIASDIPALRELGEGTPTMFVPPRDASAIAAAVGAFDAEAARPLSEAYAGIASERFSVVSTAAGLGQLYDRLLSSGAKQGVQ